MQMSDVVERPRGRLRSLLLRPLPLWERATRLSTQKIG
jgi:hypothetical protein